MKDSPLFVVRTHHADPQAPPSLEGQNSRFRLFLAERSLSSFLIHGGVPQAGSMPFP